MTNLNLIEILEQYRRLLRFQSKEAAEKFLTDSVDPALHDHIRGTFNEFGDLCRSDQSTFYWKW